MTITATRAPLAVYRSSAVHRATIQQLFGDAVRARPNGIYVLDRMNRLTLAALAGQAGAFQVRLRDAGVEAGDVVTVQLPNWWEAVATMHAVWALGAVVNPVTPIYRGAELRSILGTSYPKVVVAPAIYRGTDYAAMIAGALADVGHRAQVLPVERSGHHHPTALHQTPGDPDDIAMLMYTSGTTGRPKGVLHSHRTLLYEAASLAETFALDGDCVFMPSPLTHITGLLYGVLMPFQIGGSVALLSQWDADEAREVIERESCTMTVSATPFLRGLTDSYHQAGIGSHLETFVCGGADIAPALVERAEQTMGVFVGRTYGSTEMPTLCVVRPNDNPAFRLTTEGRVIGEAQARVAAPRGAVGELEVRGPELFVGYLDPGDNLGSFDEQGWFRTGDLARVAGSGEIAIVGRLKDVIVRGGENISAKEVEDLLITHPAILDVAVVAVPDDLMGERACAVVVTDDTSLDLRGLVAHLNRSGIARQKYPEALYLVSDLPRTVSGKVQKFQLRAAAAQALAAGRIEVRR